MHFNAEDLAKDAALLANLPDEQRIALLKIAGKYPVPTGGRERKETRPWIRPGA